MSALISFLPLFGRIRAAMAVTILLSLVTLAAGIALLGLSGWFLTAAALTTAGAAFNLFGPSAGVRALSFIRILSRYGEKLTGHDATLRLLSDIRQWLFARLFPIVPLGLRIGRADLVSRLTADIEALDTVFLLAFGPISTALLAGLAMTIGLAFLLPAAAWWYAAMSLSAVVLVPAALILGSRRVGAEVLDASAELRGVVLDGLDGHQDLIVFGAVQRTTTTALSAGARLARARARLGMMGAMAGGATQLLAGAAVVGTLAAGISAHAAGAIAGPMLAGVLLAVVASFEASAMLVRSATRLSSAAAAATRLRTLAAQPPAVVDSRTPAIVPPGGTIALDGVRFGYDPDRPVIDDLSLMISSGERVALVGPSGIGKSTIAQLLVRLWDPQAGAVTLNSVDLRSISLDDLRRRVSLMTQDAPVFLDTVRNNLRIGSATADDASLWSALDAARLGLFVRSLPDGLDTLLGEAGRTLSSGQARRLCLARSVLSGAEVMILDEPTTGLDPETEEAFFKDLTDIAAGRTVIVITHGKLPPGVFDRIIPLG